MTVALEPAAFAGGDAAPHGGEGWSLIGIDEVFPTNPRRLIRQAEHEMLRIWSLCRASGFGGGRLLPDTGGVLDQAAIMLDALQIMDDQAAKLAPKRKEQRRREREAST